MFSKDGVWYLYNAQSNFLSKVTLQLISILKQAEWNKLDNQTITYLLDRHIIELVGHEYDYFSMQQLKFNARNYNPTRMGLVIAPTTACNFDCPYCFEPKLNPKVISEEIIESLISFIRKHSTAKTLDLTWYGGEPLLAFPQIKQIMKHLHEDGMPTLQWHHIVTNGSLINEEICDFFNKENLNLMQITLDGNKECHNNKRFFKADKAPSFDVIYENIKMVRKRIPNCKISIRVNINKHNIDDLIEIHNKIKSDFPYDRMISVYPGLIREETVDGCNMCAHCLLPKDMLKVYSYCKERGVDISFFPERKERGCMIHAQCTYIVGPDGEIYKCWNDVTKPDRVIGNIQEDKMINTPLLTRYMIDSTPFRLECRDCNVFPICDGGCGYYIYKNVYEGGIFNQCSPLKDTAQLEKALLEGSLHNISGVKED